ncbi:hypothetical protein GCM10010129_76730 [Streptomyces fumigatiscleroticus]|nr:hypothetical protein GCM10010129_76730 [Streptomyces fumigatiscleroticus]
MLDVGGELHRQAVGAVVAVAEAALAEGFGGDAAQLLLARAGFGRFEEAGGVVRGRAPTGGTTPASTAVMARASSPRPTREAA